MNKWKELEIFLKDHPVGDSESCQKIFQGSAGYLPGLDFLIIDRLAHLIFVVTYQSLEAEDLSQLAKLLEKAYPGHFLRIQERGNGPLPGYLSFRCCPGRNPDKGRGSSVPDSSSAGAEHRFLSRYDQRQEQGPYLSKKYRTCGKGSKPVRLYLFLFRYRPGCRCLPGG